VLVAARNLSLGYDKPLFEGVNIDLREGEAVELRGRNGAGKTTVIKGILGTEGITTYAGDITLDRHMRVGIYEQEVSKHYFDLPLADAIEKMYLDRDLEISQTRIRSLMHDYLFTEEDGKVPLKRLSGGQKARFQLIAMLANNPGLLILDEPTNHLDLPSIEELETALGRYSGAILYVSHDGYFRNVIGGEVVQIGSE
jgi:ATPase subunit of ABC transporter with duplicated ATPase domains